MSKLYLKWSKFLCNFTTWFCIEMNSIETTMNQNNQFPLLNSVTFCDGLQGDPKYKSVDEILNPLSPNSDQQQFFPNNIRSLSRDKVMRINKMIIIEKIPWSFIKFSQLILKGDVWRSVWRICMWILGLKGLKVIIQEMIFNDDF